MPNPTPRAYTEDEVRDQFLEHIRFLIGYWNSEDGSNVPTTRTTRERMEGLVFSILVLLDGGTEMPGFAVTPNPHEDDRAYHTAHGENWFPEDIDIAGALHEYFSMKRSGR